MLEVAQGPGQQGEVVYTGRERRERVGGARGRGSLGSGWVKGGAKEDWPEALFLSLCAASWWLYPPPASWCHSSCCC